MMRGVQFSLQFLKDKTAKILEAGCGLGRVVKYLESQGFLNVQGIEINKDAVNYLNNYYPELNIIHGDVSNLPYSNKHLM